MRAGPEAAVRLDLGHVLNARADQLPGTDARSERRCPRASTSSFDLLRRSLLTGSCYRAWSKPSTDARPTFSARPLRWRPPRPPSVPAAGRTLRSGVAWSARSQPSRWPPLSQQRSGRSVQRSAGVTRGVAQEPQHGPAPRFVRKQKPQHGPAPWFVRSGQPSGGELASSSWLHPCASGTRTPSSVASLCSPDALVLRHRDRLSLRGKAAASCQCSSSSCGAESLS